MCNVSDECPHDLEAVLKSYLPLLSTNVEIEGDFMWATGRCWIAAHGAPPNIDTWTQGVLLKAPGLWLRQMAVMAHCGVSITNMGSSVVRGILERSEVAPFQIMLTNLSSIVINQGPDGRPMVIELAGLGELDRTEYDSIMGDEHLSEDGRQRCLESILRKSRLW